MIIIRLESCKLSKILKAETLLDSLQDLNLLLSKSKNSKKRNEELLKKNFKTVINIMLDDFEDAHKSKSSKKTDFKAEFVSQYFGDQQSTYSKLFSTIQMN